MGWIDKFNKISALISLFVLKKLFVCFFVVSVFVWLSILLYGVSNNYLYASIILMCFVYVIIYGIFAEELMRNPEIGADILKVIQKNRYMLLYIYSSFFLINSLILMAYVNECVRGNKLFEIIKYMLSFPVVSWGLYCFLIYRLKQINPESSYTFRLSLFLKGQLALTLVRKQVNIQF